MNRLRRNRIKATVINVLEETPMLDLPIDIENIILSYKGCNCVFKTYSEVMERTGLDYLRVREGFGSDDACAAVNCVNNTAVIYYNDIDKSLLRTNRIRWTFAHELGHIALKHHQTFELSRFNRGMPEPEYKIAEAEADLFASYILVPHTALYYLGIKSAEDIRDICRISQAAAENRMADYKRWHQWSKFKDAYDHKLRVLFYQILDKRYHAFYIACKRCGNAMFSTQEYCTLCGNSNKIKVSGDDIMQYRTYPKNENGQVNECLVCGNEVFPKEGEFCHICGKPVVNRCDAIMGQYADEGPGPCSISEGKDIPPNARYCPYCGGPSLFWHAGILKDWKKEKDEIVQSTKEEFWSFSEIPEEPLPF